MAHTPFDIDPGDETSAMTVIVTGRIRKEIRAYAVRKGISISELARTAFKAFLEKNDTKPTTARSSNGN
jgi:hypothetical protein